MLWRNDRSGPFRILPGLLVSVALVAAACSTTPEEPDTASAEGAATPPGAMEETALERLESAFEDLRDSSFSGVALVDHGGEVRVEGFGEADREAGVPNDGATVFDIGSLTKQFTGAAVLRLQMDGRLSVEDPVSAHLPELTGERGEITLHQLLTHTAGLPQALGDDDEPIDRADYLRLVAETPLLGEPGAEHAYSNVGYSVLAAVIEAVSGDSYEEYLRATLFEPAGMMSTGYVLPDWGARVVAVGYEDGEPAGRPHEGNWDDDGPYWHLRGNGGLLSTAEDMHRWHEALIADEILDATAKDALYGRHTTEGPNTLSYYGYGWAIFPTPMDTWLVAHDGGNGIFLADFLRFLHEDTVIFLASNDDDTVEQDMGLRLAGVVLGVDFGLQRCRIDDLGGFDVIDAFPDTEAGATIAELLELIEEADDPTAHAFIEDHVSEGLVPGASTEDLVGAVRDLQNELEGFVVDEIVQEDSFTFHVRLSETAIGQVVLSVQTGQSQPQRIVCLDVGV